MLASDAVFEEICQEVETGEKSLRFILQERKVSTRVFYDLLERDEAAAQRYARAKQRQSDLMVDEMLAIADDSGFDAQVVDGRAVVDGEAVQRARLRVDTRKWIASKLLPKKYGDRQTIALEEVTAETLLEALKKESK